MRCYYSAGTTLVVSSRRVATVVMSNAYSSVVQGPRCGAHVVLYISTGYFLFFP